MPDPPKKCKVCSNSKPLSKMIRVFAGYVCDKQCRNLYEDRLKSM